MAPVHLFWFSNTDHPSKIHRARPAPQNVELGLEDRERMALPISRRMPAIMLLLLAQTGHVRPFAGVEPAIAIAFIVIVLTRIPRGKICGVLRIRSAVHFTRIAQ